MASLGLKDKLHQVLSQLIAVPRKQEAPSLQVKELMTREVSTCGPEATLDTVARLMWDKDCGAVPIVDDKDGVIGVITDRDIALGCGLNQKAPWELTVREVWNNRQVFTCRPDDSVHTALKVMAAHRVRRLLIVDDNHRLQGILSLDDIIACTEEKTMGEGKTPVLSCAETMSMLKAVCIHH